MKNYNEMANDVLRRIGEHQTKQRDKRKVMRKVVMPACCLCLVVLLGLGMWQGGILDTKPPIKIDDSTVIGQKDTIDDKDGTGSNAEVDGDFSPNGQEPPPKDTTSFVTSQVSGKPNGDENDPIRIMWTINTVENRISAAKLNFSEDKYYSEKKTLADVTAYLGKDLSTLKSVLPQGFEFTGRYETNFYYELNGKPAYDTCAFNFKKDEQWIRIVASKIGAPYDCVYMLNNPTVSNINGVEVIMGGIFKDDKSEGYELVFADFSHDGIQYRVTGENVLFDGGKDVFSCLYGIVCELTK